jgi:streptogramin lyase
VLPPDKELEAEPARDNTLVRIDPRRGRVEARLKPGSDPRDMAADRRGLWITDIEGLVRLDVESGRERRHTTLEEGPNGIAIGEGSIWLTDASQNTVIEADPSNGKVVGLPVEVPSETEGVSGEVGDIAAGEGAVWVGNETAPKLARIRP